jgi:hypothetical protein
MTLKRTWIHVQTPKLPTERGLFFCTIGKHLKKRQTKMDVEMCNARSTLLPDFELHPECPGCTKWYEHIPIGTVQLCKWCDAVLIVTKAKKCPMCGERIERELDEDESSER